LLSAYRQGIFPWYNPDEPILWWCPDPRAVLELSGMRVSRSLGKSIRNTDYSVSFDAAFNEVLLACGAPRARSHGTWLGDDMRRAYIDLFHQGYAHSVEVWRERQLIGGLYGVAIGGVFFGESMFSRATDASKIALYWLCEQLRAWQFDLLDCQISSPHLISLGAQEISREDFLKRLSVAVTRAPGNLRWQFDIDVPRDPRQGPA